MFSFKSELFCFASSFDVIAFCARHWLHSIFILHWVCVSIYNVFSCCKALIYMTLAANSFIWPMGFGIISLILQSDAIWVYNPYPAPLFLGVPIALGFLYLPYYTETWLNLPFVIDLRILARYIWIMFILILLSVLSAIAWFIVPQLSSQVNEIL